MSANTRLLLVLSLIALGMLALGFAFVPLYRLFCQVAGIPVPSIAVQAQAPAPVGDVAPSGRQIQVRFIANNAQGMPVQLRPLEHVVMLPLGQPYLTAYTAYNPSRQVRDGVAVHTLNALGGASGQDATPYIHLQQCFCFEEQSYPAQQQVHLPLEFTISPALPADVHTITFSYTVFESLAAAPAAAVAAKGSLARDAQF